MIRGRAIEVSCKNCQMLFLARVIKIKEGGGIFCSRKCHVIYRSSHKKDEKRRNVFHQKKHKYGLTEDQYLKMFIIQNNKCAICETEFGIDRNTRANVDHCHVTNNVRGLLCNKCNTLLGMANDDVQILEKARQYLYAGS